MDELSALIAKAGPTFVLALIASWTFLMLRYLPLRRPFAKPRSARLAIFIILFTATTSTAAGFLVPKVVGGIPPFLAGLAPPTLMFVPSVANRTRNQFKDTSASAVIRAFLTMFIATLLGVLDRILVEQRDQFGQLWAAGIWNDRNRRSLAEELYLRLKRRQEEPSIKALAAKTQSLTPLFNSFTKNLAEAERSQDDEKIKEHLFKSRFALERLLSVAYDLRAESIVESVVRQRRPAARSPRRQATVEQGGQRP
jgi:hypothetical protein